LSIQEFFFSLYILYKCKITYIALGRIFFSPKVRTSVLTAIFFLPESHREKKTAMTCIVEEQKISAAWFENKVDSSFLFSLFGTMKTMSISTHCHVWTMMQPLIYGVSDVLETYVIDLWP